MSLYSLYSDASSQYDQQLQLFFRKFTIADNWHLYATLLALPMLTSNEEVTWLWTWLISRIIGEMKKLNANLAKWSDRHLFHTTSSLKGRKDNSFCMIIDSTSINANLIAQRSNRRVYLPLSKNFRRARERDRGVNSTLTAYNCRPCWRINVKIIKAEIQI